MGEQRIQGNENVQIQDVDRSLIEITYNKSSCTVPLEPAHIPVAAKLPSPARLVRAHSGVVPYVERGGLLADLEDWIDTPEPFAGHVIGGRGGAGKTRLAVQLCEELRRNGWLCGFLSRIADQGMLDALVQAPTASLVVIDYAENRAEQAEMLLPLLQAKATAETPVRVLLLVRTGPTQATKWPERLGNRIDALDAVLDECEVRILEDTPLRAEDRADLFQVAVAAFAARLEMPSAPAPPPDLKEGVFENPLMVVIAAYLAAHGEEAPSTRGELLDEVLAHERRYWRETSTQLDADDALLERMVALATLVNAETEARAAEQLQLLPDLTDAVAERRSGLARWVRGQYPGPRWWNPLEPDLVGEHLVARCFTDKPTILHGALAGDEPEEITRPLEVLARAGADHPDLASALGSIFGDELGRLCGIAVAQAGTVKDRDLLFGSAVTVAAAIDAATSAVEVDLHALPAAVDLMPRRSDLVLNELAATLTAQDVERRLRPLAVADPAIHVSNLASALNNLSLRLAAAGREEEALAASEESVEIRRPLTAADPAAHAVNLASALSNLSSRLAAAGRGEEALAASEESVDTYRPLAAANPAIHVSNLASALNNLSNRLAAAGHGEEALAAIEETVEIRRPLAAANPAAHAPHLASALSNLSLRLAAAGHGEEALAAIEESVDTYRPLAAANPAAHAVNLAGALSNLSGRLADAGRGEEALTASEESVYTYRPLAAANPAGYVPDLAGALNNLSNRLADASRGEEALAAIEESVEIRRSLAAANPAAHALHLAGALNNLSLRLADASRGEEALAAIEESVDTYRPLAAANLLAHAPDLAGALINLSDALDDNGRNEDAENARREASELLPHPGKEAV